MTRQRRQDGRHLRGDRRPRRRRQGHGFCPSDTTLVSVIEYPDELSAKRSVAGILALQSLEFVSVDHLWDIIEWVGIVRETTAAS